MVMQIMVFCQEISAVEGSRMLRCAASFVIAAYDKYASFLADSHALPANFLRSRQKF